MKKMLTFFWKKMRRNQKGFTLIELIVVIAILGVLAAIAVPNVMGTLSRAKEDADKATAATIANAALEYLIKNPSGDPSGEVTEGSVLKDYLNRIPTPQKSGYKNFYVEVDKTNKVINVYYSDGTGKTGSVLSTTSIEGIS